jgi:hypothetical protein
MPANLYMKYLVLQLKSFDFILWLHAWIHTECIHHYFLDSFGFISYSSICAIELTTVCQYIRMYFCLCSHFSDSKCTE